MCTTMKQNNVVFHIRVSFTLRNKTEDVSQNLKHLKT